MPAAYQIWAQTLLALIFCIPVGVALKRTSSDETDEFNIESVGAFQLVIPSRLT